MFDIYSQRGDVKGELVLREGDSFVYKNTQIVTENGVEKIPSGQSYMVVIGDREPIDVEFEGEHGAGNGITDALLIEMLIHRNKMLLDAEYTEQRALAIRSLQLALDSLQHKEVA